MATRKRSVKKANAESSIEIGSSGLRRNNGRVNEEFLRNLQGRKGFETYREMRENDETIGAILFAIDMLIRQVEWRIEPASANASDVEAADFIESCRLDMNITWEGLISEILSMLTYGWAFFEIVYKFRQGKNKDQARNSKYNDGRIGWRKIALRAQDTLFEWKFGEDGGIEGMTQCLQNGTGKVDIPIEKALLFRTSNFKNNPEGRSILRNAYRSWYFKKRIEEIEAIGIERDLAGLPVMMVPARIMSGEASAMDRAILDACKDIVRNIRRDEQEGVVMPSDYDDKGNLQYELKLLTTGGSRQFDTNTIINRKDQRIAMTVLADFILLGHEKVGSFALSSDKTDLFATAIAAYLGEIASVFNRYAITKLLDLNGMSGQCEIKYGDIESPDLVALGDFITKLSSAGAELFPDDDLENDLRKKASLPLKPIDNV
jgi:hypothetical protein